MDKSSLTAVARNQLEAARSSTSGRAAQTVYGGHQRVLRQAVIAMVAGAGLSEHENPGEATIQVLTGRVILASGDVSWEGRPGALLAVPQARHRVEALEDSVILLTVAKLGE
ncbi:MAG: cupin domain-containing protein [Cellulomonadaceae bacterium]